MQTLIGVLFSTMVASWRQRMGRKRRGCRRMSLGCASLLLLLLLAACGLLFWIMVLQPQTAAAASLPPSNSLAVTLLVDNSNSMFELGGQGSDPELLRLDAARLFISYLGVDNPQADHTCSVIFFGSEAQVVVPMTRLADDQRRQDMYQLIQNPPRMGWTDHAAALALAQSQPPAEGIGRQSAYILLTDGKPDWSNEATEAEKHAYAARLRQVSQQLAQSETPLFIILLANEATDADPDIARIWQPLWQDMAATTAPGQFYEARQAEDLISIYHDIVVLLTGGQSAPPFIQEMVPEDGLNETIMVEENLARLTLVISKSEVDQVVAIRQPDGKLLTRVAPNVRFAGGGDDVREEIWVIDAPVAGSWALTINGPGRVTVWQDAWPVAPTPTPLATFTATLVQTPTAQPSTTMTPTIPVRPTQIATIQAVAAVEIVKTALPQPSPKVVDEPAPWGWWGGGTLLVMATAVWAARRHSQRQRVIVTGTLRHLAGPGFVSGLHTLDLDSWQRPALQIGSHAADVTLADADVSFTLAAQAASGGELTLVIRGEAGVRLNDLPLINEQPLQDADVITVGHTRLRYENLRLRQARQRQIQPPVSWDDI